MIPQKVMIDCHGITGKCVGLRSPMMLGRLTSIHQYCINYGTQLKQTQKDIVQPAGIRLGNSGETKCMTLRSLEAWTGKLYTNAISSIAINNISFNSRDFQSHHLRFPW